MSVIFVDQAIDQLHANFRGELIRPGGPAYDEARQVRNGLIDRYPAVIARCAGTADVIAAVNFAREHDLLLSIRGGSHNVSGAATNDGGIVVDLSLMRGVWVDPATRTARVQGGATWGDVDRETQLFGLATPGGVVSTTGVGGLTLHGGWGWLRRPMATVSTTSSRSILLLPTGRSERPARLRIRTSSGPYAGQAAILGSLPALRSGCTRSRH